MEEEQRSQNSPHVCVGVGANIWFIFVTDHVIYYMSIGLFQDPAFNANSKSSRLTAKLASLPSIIFLLFASC